MPDEVGGRLVFGCGTGRCGTKSLAELLNLQIGTTVAHEGAVRTVNPRPVNHWLKWGDTRGWLPPWNPTLDASAMVDEIVRQVRLLDRIAGDISFAWCRYVELLEEHGARVICLQRGREATIASYLRRPKDNATVDPPAAERPGVMSYQALPKFDCPTREENARELWNEYYGQAVRIALRHPDTLRIFDTETALNTESGQRDMLEWAGFDAPRIHAGIRADD